MGIAVEVISAILKSVASSKIGNELCNEITGIFIDEVTGKSIDEIKDFINEGKVKIEHILSKENMKSMNIPEDNIDYIVAEIKTLFSRIDITDEVFRRCKYDSTNLSCFLWDEYCKLENCYVENQSSIRQGLFAIAETLNKLICESENFEKDLMIQISNTVDDNNTAIQNISNYIKVNLSKLDENSQMILNILQIILMQIQSNNLQNKNIQKKVESRTQEYAEKWNENMFLNNFDEWDEKAGVNIKLSDVYLEEHLPHFIYGANENESTNLKKLLTEYIEKRNSNQMLLILGQPGIGKSTLITWITANFHNCIEDILVYRFAFDLKNIEWGKDNISEAILEKLGYSYNDLNGKVLILDGLDEWSVKIDKKLLLDKIYENLIYKKNIKNLTIIVTCRVNYIHNFYNVKYKYITLCPWDENQIKKFCSVFQNKTDVYISEFTVKSAVKNRNILGIPLILYMVVALNIPFENKTSIVNVYDKIFSLEGGIYDRCIDNKQYADSHRISESKKQIHQLSRDVAIWIFENNPHKAYIPQEEYKKICIKFTQDTGQKENVIEQDFTIGNFFKIKHCEGREGEELYFVHRSIYEYFVAESIYSSIEDCMSVLSDKGQEELASNIAVYLKQGEITYTIGEYLQRKIFRLFNKLSSEKKDRFYGWWEEAVAKMMDKGMFYYTNRNINYYENIISKECQCFKNVFIILRLFLFMCNEKYVMTNIDRKLLEKYIKYCLVESRFTSIINNEGHEVSKKHEGDYCFAPMEYTPIELIKLDFIQMDLHEMDLTNIDLKRIYLNHTNLKGANLIGVNLKEKGLIYVDLTKANLNEADLSRVDLSSSNLTEANLKGANLNEAILEGADLTNVDLRFANLIGANLEGANLEGAILDELCVRYIENKYNLKLINVYINSTQETITYEEYCKREH